MNQAFRKQYSGIDYQKILSSKYHFGFDESKGLTLLLKENGFKQYKNKVYVDTNPFIYDFFHDIDKCYMYSDGKIIQKHKDHLENEYMYIHLQKRKMYYDNTKIKSSSGYYINPDGFSNFPYYKSGIKLRFTHKLRILSKTIISKINWNFHWKIAWIIASHMKGLNEQ